MSILRIQFAAAALVATFATQTHATSLVTFGNPWEERATVVAAMDLAFGSGGWTDRDSPADSGFLASESFLYMEGGDGTTNEMESFLNAQSASILNWVSGGGRLLINAAPNQGDGLSFGGLTLNYLTSIQKYCESLCTPVDPSSAMFTGITTASFGGNYFSHGTVSGGTTEYIRNENGESLLSSIGLGAGAIFMGTMTTTNFHSVFGSEALQLRANILEFAATGTVDPVPEVPLPAAGWMLLAGLAGLAGMARRKQAA